MKVSIITPIFKTQDYIEQCARSLFEQDFDDIEYIFIDDCTPDKSIDILNNIIKDYPNRENNIKIISHSQNMGLGKARKTGLENASSDYILQIDSDDWCEKDMVSSLYKKAIDTNSDIVASDFYKNYTNKQTYEKQSYNNCNDVFSSILSGEIDNSLSNKLIKRSLYINNNVIVPAHISMAEDRYAIIQLYYYANSTSYINRAFLHYRQNNPYSLMFNYTEKSFLEFCSFVKEIEKFLKDNNIYYKYKNDFFRLLSSHIHIFYKYSPEFIQNNYPDGIKIKYIMNFKKSKLSIRLAKVLILLSPKFFRNKLIDIYSKLRR